MGNSVGSTDKGSAWHFLSEGNGWFPGWIYTNSVKCSFVARSLCWGVLGDLYIGSDMGWTNYFNDRQGWCWPSDRTSVLLFLYDHLGLPISISKGEAGGKCQGKKGGEVRPRVLPWNCLHTNQSARCMLVEAWAWASLIAFCDYGLRIVWSGGRILSKDFQISLFSLSCEAYSNEVVLFDVRMLFYKSLVYKDLLINWTRSIDARSSRSNTNSVRCDVTILVFRYYIACFTINLYMNDPFNMYRSEAINIYGTGRFILERPWDCVEECRADADE